MTKLSKERMKVNAEREKKIAFEKDHFIKVMRNGVLLIVIFITVTDHGSWRQRTYHGGAYDSLGGVVIIRYFTGEAIDIIDKCKTCAICDKTIRKNREIQEHLCFRHFDGNKSSGARETESAVEAFATGYEK